MENSIRGQQLEDNWLNGQWYKGLHPTNWRRLELLKEGYDPYQQCVGVCVQQCHFVRMYMSKNGDGECLWCHTNVWMSNYQILCPCNLKLSKCHGKLSFHIGNKCRETREHFRFLLHQKDPCIMCKVIGKENIIFKTRDRCIMRHPNIGTN